MRWSERLYVGLSLADEQEQVRRQIERGDGPTSLRVITLAVGKDDLLDIRLAREWFRHWGQAEGPMIVGIASGRREALELVRTIAQQCYASRGDVDLRRFFTD